MSRTPIGIFALAAKNSYASTPIAKIATRCPKLLLQTAEVVHSNRAAPRPPGGGLARHLFEDALNRMQDRVTPEAMKLRRSTVEHPFATIKYRIFGHPRLLMRGLSGARIELGIATMAYNLKRITKVLGAAELTKALHCA